MVATSNVRILKTKAESGRAAAEIAAGCLKEAIQKKGRAVFIAATGASQFDFLEALVATPGIDWSKTTMFHLDEYLGLPSSHPASFRKYLKERFISKVKPGVVHLCEGDAPNAEAERKRLSALIAKEEVDVAFVGIGENAHLAFNDPPADFETNEPYLIVTLDEACRKQQMGEGWFKTVADVPEKAISMSVRQIGKAKVIICTVPDARKAQAVKLSLEGPVVNTVPASILQKHPACHFFLDEASASLLSKR
ncbi:MAG: glucosamine-6-phosphate deaminase [Spirochaetia bacterium]|nr:glucosamine-6-phosphate deaminase [Spirochaetia bacterium]